MESACHASAGGILAFSKCSDMLHPAWIPRYRSRLSEFFNALFFDAPWAEPFMTDAVSSPFDDIRRLITTMPGPDEAAVEAVRLRERQLTKPAGSLGRLEWRNEWLAAWQATRKPSGDRPLVSVYVGSLRAAAAGLPHSPSRANR